MNRFIFFALLFASIACANDDPFPRLGGVNNGGAHNYDDATYQDNLARLDVVIVGTWPGWNNSKRSLESVVRNIHATNPRTRVFQYINSMEVSSVDASVALYYRKVDDAHWWLTSPAAPGAKILSEYGVQTGKAVYQINTTLFGPKDSDGRHEYEWHAHWAIDQFLKPNPSLDGFFEDNVFYQPRIAGDWNLDGVRDTPEAAAKWHRDAYRARFALLHQLMQGKLIIGNISDWGKSKSDLTELRGTLDGGLIEGLLGSNYSPEKFAGGWLDMLRHYRKTMAAIAEPKLVLFHNVGTSTDYQAMRYGLASCLLDDGYFAFTDTAKGYDGVTWFDEFDARLGNATSSPPVAAWQKGVYRRDFENGIALVNPKGNGAQDLSLEAEFRKIAGKQAPTVNDGAAVKSVRLLDRDGIILLRSRRTLPGAPTLK